MDTMLPKFEYLTYNAARLSVHPGGVYPSIFASYLKKKLFGVYMCPYFFVFCSVAVPVLPLPDIDAGDEAGFLVFVNILPFSKNNLP